MKGPQKTESNGKPLPPDILFHAGLHLMVYRPRGILSEQRVQGIIDFLEMEEDQAETPFNRFTDLSKLEALDLDLKAMIRISLYRRLAYGKYPPVKSAFYVTSPAAARVVRVHVIVTDRSSLNVRMFLKMSAAATWLGVPPAILELDKGASGRGKG
jgi:hypothetical protein